jgi:hypothetical protein
LVGEKEAARLALASRPWKPLVCPPGLALPTGCGFPYVVVREGKNLKGKFFELVFRTVGKGQLKKAFVNSVKVIEARNYEPTTADPRTPTTTTAA